MSEPYISGGGYMRSLAPDEKVDFKNADVLIPGCW